MERINAPNFPDVALYQDGNLYRIEFRQYEHFSLWGAVLSLLLGMLLLCVAVLVSVPLGFWSSRQGVPWFIPVAVLFVLAWRGWRWLEKPPLRRRAIELDRGADEIRVYRGSKLTERRQLSQLDSLAIEDHPLSQNERNADPSRIGPYQKQHCLVGYFGAGGGEKVLLMTRFEFPNERSLLQVRAAIQFLLQRPVVTAPVRQGPVLN